MTSRRRLTNRRSAATISFDHSTQRYHLTMGFYDDGSLGEIFVNSSQKLGSEADVNASDAAVAVSLALQYGCPLSALRESMKRTPNGEPMGPLARALDAAHLFLKEQVK